MAMYHSYARRHIRSVAFFFRFFVAMRPCPTDEVGIYDSLLRLCSYAEFQITSTVLQEMVIEPLHEISNNVTF